MAASVYAAMLAKTPLTWFGVAGRVPTGISAESGGGGDDLQIRFGSGSLPEVQVRRRMNGKSDFTKLVGDIVARTSGKSPAPVALVAGRLDSSSTLFTDIRRDLDGLRAKVEEGRLTKPVSGMLADPETRRALESLYIVDADFDSAHSPDRENALEKLRRRLVDETKADEAWTILLADALEICAKGSSRDTEDLVSLLARNGLLLRPSTVDEELRPQLESIRERVLEQHYPQLATDELRRLLGEIVARHASAETQSEAMRLLAHAHLALDRLDEARADAYRAVELDRDSAAAHATYARVLLARGELASARDEADQALAIDPESRRAWLAHLEVSLKANTDAGEPPAALRADRVFCVELAAARVNQGRLDEALALTEPLLALPDPTSGARYIHATVLTGIATRVVPPDAVGLRRADTELTMLLGSLRHDHPLLAQIYYQRANVRRLLGDEAGAVADEALVRKVNRDNPEIVERMAVASVGQGDAAGALAILETDVVSASPSLLAFRASLLAAAGRIDEAKRDLEAAVAALPAADDPDRMAWQLGEAAIDIGDLDRARAFHDGMSEEWKGGAYGHVLRGSIAFAEDKLDEGKESYEAAIKTQEDESQADLLRLRLASALNEAGRAKEAMVVFDEMGFDRVPDGAMRSFIITAFVAGNLPAAKRGLDRVAKSGPLPRWALSISADIALRSDDPAAVVEHLTALQQDGEASARVRLTLARVLIELGKMAPALEQVRAAIAGPTTPMEKLEAGVYLKRLGHGSDAIAQAFCAYREDRNDPNIQRTLASLIATGRVELAAPTTVVAGSHVRLGRADGAKRNHSIFSEPPVEKAAGELLVDEAVELLGHAVGDEIARDRKPLPDEIWTVEEIVLAEIHAGRTIMATFRDTFPNEPWFVETIHVGQLDKPEDFTELLTMLGSRATHVAKLLEIYHEQVMPLEFIANNLRATIPEVMELGRDPAGAPLLIEWAAAADYTATAHLGEDAKTLVLTRSALVMAWREGLLPTLLSNYELVAPRSLERQLRDEVEEATEAMTHGRQTLASAPAGWAMTEVEPNHASLIAVRDSATETLAWVLENVELVPRPLEGLGRTAADQGEVDQDALRERMGPASFDASALVSTGAGILYADDLGLRRYPVRGAGPVPGISTATLIEALLLRGTIPATERGRVHADLILAGCAFVPPSAELLAEAMHRMPSLGLPAFRALFEALSSPLCDPRVAVGLIAQVLKSASSQTIERVSLEDVAEAAMRGLARKWGKPAAVELVRAIANRELRLLPHHAVRVEKVCDRVGAEAPLSL